MIQIAVCFTFQAKEFYFFNQADVYCFMCEFLYQELFNLNNLRGLHKQLIFYRENTVTIRLKIYKRNAPQNSLNASFQG